MLGYNQLKKAAEELSSLSSCAITANRQDTLVSTGTVASFLSAKFALESLDIPF